MPNIAVVDLLERLIILLIVGSTDTIPERIGLSDNDQSGQTRCRSKIAEMAASQVHMGFEPFRVLD